MKPDDSEFSLPQQQVSIDVLLEKYAKGDERTADDVRRRVARALAAVEQDPAKWEKEFFEALAGGFIPGGRVNSAAGTDLQATLINCFVQPVGDSVSQAVDGRPGIYVALKEAAETMRRGGGVGYDFSSIRPKGAFVRGTHSSASGPVSYMRVFDRSCETVESAGSRRGAQMGILRCDHPDIENFIHAKDHGDLSNFNVSIAVTDAFMRAVESDGDWDLVHKTPPGGEIGAAARQRADGAWIYRTVKARDLWEQVMQSTYDHAEPGIVFIDRINADDNLSYCERLDATNPCVTADTRLHTAAGLIPVGDLYATGERLQVTVDKRALGEQGNGTFTRPAVPVFLSAHEAEVFRVATVDGYEIKATAWHDFFTGRGKVKLRDLLVGDELLVQSGKGQFGEQGSKDLGTLLGLIAGDGHFTNRGKDQQAAIVNFWGADQSLAPRVAAFINSLITGLAVAPRSVPSRARRSTVAQSYVHTFGPACAIPGAIWFFRGDQTHRSGSRLAWYRRMRQRILVRIVSGRRHGQHFGSQPKLFAAACFQLSRPAERRADPARQFRRILPYTAPSHRQHARLARRPGRATFLPVSCRL